MARLRQNFQSGDLSAGLTIGGTTLTSAQLAGFQAVVAPDIAVIVLDPHGVDGAPEIVHVTAHTALALTATILRAQEGTVARAHNVATDWEHNITEDDFTYSNLSGLPVITAGVAVEDEGAAEGQADTIDFAGAGVSVAFAAGTATVTVAGGGGSANAVRNQRTSGFITLNSVTWTDVDNTLDIVIAAVTGDWIEVGVSGFWFNGATNGYLDACSVVAGAPVNMWGSNAAPDNNFRGVSAWTGVASREDAIGGSVIREVLAGDLSGGNVTLRLRARTGVAVNKILGADGSGGFPLIFWARNLGT